MLSLPGHYDPKLGRFITADTIDPDLTNPQSLNRYSYTLNNPLKYTDPSGHSPLAIAMFIPGAQEIAALVTGYLILKWSFEQLSRAIETMPTINLGLKLPGFDRSAKPPPSVESPTQADLKYTPEGMTYTEMPETGVLKAETKTYRHYGYEKDAESFKDGLKPDSYATQSKGRPMKGRIAQQKLSLPHEEPPDAYYKVKPKAGTSIGHQTKVKPTDIPPRTGGGKEYKFPKGTGKGTVTGPYKIEP